MENIKLAIAFIADNLKNPWVLFGFAAQFLFFSRFIIQWMASEKAKKVVIPMMFWYLSIIGAVMIFIYAVYRLDIVFMASSSLSLIIYARNIVLHKNYNNDQDN